MAPQSKIPAAESRGLPAGKRRASIGPHRNPASATAILDAAEAILDERGHAGFSIEAVARRAGAGKPTVYRWWPSKGALLLDVYGRRKNELPDPDTGSLEGDLTALVRGLWRFWRETPAGAVYRSIVAEAQSDPSVRDAFTRYAEDRRHHIGEFVARARDRGELRGDADVVTFTDIFSGYIWGRLLTNRIDDDPAEIARAIGHMVRGIAATKPAGPSPART